MNYRDYLPTQQNLMLLLFLVPVLVVLDWRFHAQNETLSQGDLIPDLPAQLIAATETKVELPTVFASQQTEPVQAAPAVVGLSADAQSKQQGLLNKLYIGKEVYRLRGIIQRGTTTALLQVENLEGAEKRRLELKAGDELAPYQVLEVSSKRILLQQGERQLWLQLFVPQRAATAAPSQP